MKILWGFEVQKNVIFAGFNPDLDSQVFFPYNWAHIVLGKINRSLRLNHYEREAHSAST